MMVLLLSVSACDEGGGSDDAASDGAVRDTYDVEEGTCIFDVSESEAAEQAAVHHEEMGFWIWECTFDQGYYWEAANVIQLEFWSSRGMVAEPGVYPLAGDGYADCGLCLLLREGCLNLDGLADCEADHFAVAGEVEITEIGVVGETISGTIRDAHLVETWIDWESGSFDSEPVPGGATWCIEEWDFEAEVVAYPIR